MLRRLYAQRLPVKQIAGELGRSPDAIVARRKALRIPPRRTRIWSAREDDLLRAGTAAGVSATVLGALLGRSPDRVRARRRMLIGRRPAGRPYLSHEDEQIRICVTGDGDLAGVARRLGRTPDALRLRAKQLGLHDPPPRRRWSDWEDAIVRDGYTSALPCGEIARGLPGRTAASVAARARRLGLVGYARRWTADDDRRLVRLVARGDALEDIAQWLNRTPEAVRRRATRLGIAPRPSPALRRAQRWTREEDELLRLHQALNPALLAQLWAAQIWR